VPKATEIQIALPEPGNEASLVEHTRRGIISRLPLSVQVAIVAAAVLLLFLTIYSLPLQGDWKFFYRAAQHPLAPYRAEPSFLNPAWMAWILAPFALLPEHLAGALWICLSIMATVWCIHRLEGDYWDTLLCLLSPAFIRFITAGQLDVVPLLGLVVMVTATRPAVKGIGLILLAAKPQTLGAGAVVVWLRSTWRERLGFVLPLLCVLLLSILVYGLWPLRVHLDTLNKNIDISPWPYGIPIGLVLLAWAAVRNQPRIGALATCFLSPHLPPYTLFAYTAVLFPSVPRWVSITVFMLMWAVALATL